MRFSTRVTTARGFTTPALAVRRWGHTALDEATREQRRDVIGYLEKREAAATGRRK